VENELTVAKYRDAQEKNKQAIVYLPAKTDEDGKTIAGSDKASHFRYEKWLSASEAIKKHTAEQSLFVSFWDNAQRIHLFTGRKTWVNGPDKNAYSSKEDQTLWESIAGGFDSDKNLLKYSQYLLQDMETGIAELQKELPDDRDTYLLVTNDDLAHIQEMAVLTGQGLPLETKLFPAGTDLHNSISKVKEWAKEENGTGSYLIQPISEKFNRVWRITDKTFEESLLVRLLPFTSSLDRPFIKTKLVYQSDWGAYLSIYQLIN
jgi:hydroxylamine oxidation protein HaoB